MIKRDNLISARGNHTQEEIAQLCGVKQQTYSHWETGRATPSIQKMIVLERLLKVPKEQLFEDVINSSSEYKANQAPTGTEG